MDARFREITMLSSLRLVSFDELLPLTNAPFAIYKVRQHRLFTAIIFFCFIKLSVRRLVCIFLLMILPLHTFALQGGWLSKEKTMDIVHEIEHVNGTSHHHEDDGSIHYDDSKESAKHSVDHESVQQTEALPLEDLPLLAISFCLIRSFPSGLNIPDRFLERPQRPPSALG